MIFAVSVESKMKVRFYFTQQDFYDVKNGMASFEGEIQEFEDLIFYTLSKASLHPFAIVTQPAKGVFTMYNTKRDGQAQWYRGTQNNVSYAEFEIDDLNVSGGAGYKIALEDKLLAVSGQILDKHNQPLSSITVFANGEPKEQSNVDGYYAFSGLFPGKDYDIQPIKDDLNGNITVLDLIAVSRHAFVGEPIENYYSMIAGDINGSNAIKGDDVKLMQDLILGNVNLPKDKKWQFFQKAINSSSTTNPFAQKLDRFIRLENVKQDIRNVDFVGVMTGDVWQEKSFPNHPPSQVDPAFVLSDEKACGGGEVVVVPIEIDDFKGVHGFQFAIKWDPAILDFLEVTSFSLPQMTMDNFGINQVGEGELRVVWFTPNFTKANILKNGTEIFELKFKSKGSNGDFSKIEFDDKIMPFQVLRGNLSSANVNFSIGSVRIDNSTPIRISKDNVTDVSCAGSTDGRIKIKAKGGKSPYGYNWSNGMSGREIEGLAPGMYIVTITDAANCPFTSEAFEVKEPGPIVIKERKIKSVACPEDTNGKIDIQVKAGSKPYSYEWSNGSKSEDLENIGGGKYQVTVTDDNKCQQFASFNIPIPGRVYVSHVVADATPELPNSGSISIMEMNGGSPPYSYHWSTGARSPSVTALEEGKYRVSIVDKNNCENVYDFSVDTKELVQDFKVGISAQKELINTDEWAYVVIESAVQQNVQFKWYDTKSKLIEQKPLLLKRGRMQYYVKTPATPGVYLLQVIAQGGKVSSLRMKVE